MQQLVEQCLGEEAHVMRGREDASLAGDSTHAAGGGVVDDAAEKVVEVGVGDSGALVVMLAGGGALQRKRWPYNAGRSASS